MPSEVFSLFLILVLFVLCCGMFLIFVCSNKEVQYCSTRIPRVHGIPYGHTLDDTVVCTVVLSLVPTQLLGNACGCGHARGAVLLPQLIRNRTDCFQQWSTVTAGKIQLFSALGIAM